MKKIFQPLSLLNIGRKLKDPYCSQFDEHGYDKDYKYYKEDDVVSRLSESLSDEQLVEIVKMNPDAVYKYWSFYGKYYTFDNARGELRLESVWPMFYSRLEEVFQKHGRATWAVLKAYIELREDYSTWSSCDYNRLQYRARELAGKGWKDALTALEIAKVVQKRGSGRRPGERSIAIEMIPLVEEVVQDWEKRLSPQEPTPILQITEVKSQAFVCYSHQDSPFVDRLVKDLKSRGIKPWLDKWEIKVGDSIMDKINEGIRQNDYLIIVLSKASVKSEWVKKELNAGLMKELEKKSVVVLPLLLEDCDIPPLIADKKYADFRQSYDAGLAELLKRFES
ncbi:MAG: toll/interleukin-1 receptor domain-containing protein [Thermoproteota archaeon]